MMLDAFSWSASALTSQGEHILVYMQSELENRGVEVFPVVGYDRWDDPIYKLALGSMELPPGRAFCIRLDSDAIEDTLDTEYFSERISEITSSLGVRLEECIVLLDLADLSQLAIDDVIDPTSAALSVLSSMGARRMILAGSSIPDSINIAVPQAESEGKLFRKEMIIWQTLVSTFPSLTFGDYGVRSPRSNDDVIAPDTNGKIRYTIPRQFYIARGYSLRTREKGAQHHELSKKIMNSGHWLGAGFSWGDSRIKACASGEFRGNSTDWIAIDTNHHLKATVAEVVEFGITIRELV
jgi:hypothetical protein